jgi:hypothetical protein
VGALKVIQAGSPSITEWTFFSIVAKFWSYCVHAATNKDKQRPMNIGMDST